MDKSSAWHNQNVIGLLLQQFNQTQALRMIEHIHGLRQVMQFALNPNHDLLRFDLMLEMKRDDRIHIQHAGTHAQAVLK